MLKGRNVKMRRGQGKRHHRSRSSREIVVECRDRPRANGRQAPHLAAQAVHRQGHSTISALPFVVSQAHKMVPPEDNGGFAAHKLIDAVEAAVELPFEFGLAREARLFERARALGAVGCAAPRVLRRARAREDSRTSGGQTAARSRRPASSARARWARGIAITFAQAGIPVHVSIRTTKRSTRRSQTVMGMFMYQVQKGRMTQEEAWKRGQSVQFTDDYERARRRRRRRRGRLRKHGRQERSLREARRRSSSPKAILAIEYLDARHRRDGRGDEAPRQSSSACTSSCRPTSCRCSRSCAARTRRRETIATAFKLGKTLRKTAVLSANAFGFIGNRMIFDYAREAVALAEEGVSPARIDAVAKNVRLPDGTVRDERSLGHRRRLAHLQERAATIGKGRTQRRRSSGRDEAPRAEDDGRATSSTTRASAKAASRFPIPRSKRSSPKKRKKAGIKPREVTRRRDSRASGRTR